MPVVYDDVIGGGIYYAYPLQSHVEEFAGFEWGTSLHLGEAQVLTSHADFTIVPAEKKTPVPLWDQI